MPSTSATRLLSIAMLKHPKLAKALAPLHRGLFLSMPTAYHRLMNGTDADARRVKKRIPKS